MPADIPSNMAGLFVSPGSNQPTDSTLISSNLDDNIRQILSILRTVMAIDALAAAATTDLSTKDSTLLDITGSGATITSFGTVSAGIWKIVFFAGNNTVANGAAIDCPGSLNVQVQSGDAMLLRSNGANAWKVVGFWPKSGGYASNISIASITGSGAKNVDASASENHVISSITGNLTLSFINPKPSGSLSVFALVVKMGGTAYTITWPGAVRWPGGSAPALSGINKTDMFSFWTDDGGTTWYGAQTGKAW